MAALFPISFPPFSLFISISIEFTCMIVLHLLHSTIFHVSSIFAHVLCSLIAKFHLFCVISHENELLNMIQIVNMEVKIFLISIYWYCCCCHYLLCSVQQLGHTERERTADNRHSVQFISISVYECVYFTRLYFIIDNKCHRMPQNADCRCVSIL